MGNKHITSHPKSDAKHMYQIKVEVTCVHIHTHFHFDAFKFLAPGASSDIPFDKILYQESSIILLLN